MTAPRVAFETCTRRLVALDVPDLADVDLTISWHGPALLPSAWPATEATIQARCGLMDLHGRDAGVPRRLGVDVASVAAGLLASQGRMAAAVGRSRGWPGASVHTSVLQAGLVLLSHYFVVATALGDAVPGPPLPAPGPPFRSADGVWFEIETLDGESWKAWWTNLGAGHADLGRGWTVFRWRYERAACSLPVGLHEAAGRHSLDDLMAVADATGVSLVPLRLDEQVPEELGPAAAHPVLQPLPGPVDAALAPQSAPAPTDLPLAGLRVVEATSRIQGPFAGMLLRMLGAGVVRVQPPEGDYGRAAQTLHRGKDVVRLDMDTPAGRSELVELVAGADVFLHNWRPGKAAEWGVAAHDLATVNQRLVYAAASGWGPRDDAGSLLGTDFLVQAWTGLGAALNPEGEPPFPSRMILSDLFGALVGAEGVLAGLYRRETTGRGWVVGSSLVAGALSLLAGGAGGRRRWGVLDRPVPASDGHVVVEAGDEETFRRLCAEVGVGAGGPAAADAVAARLASRPAGEWENVLGAAGVPCAALPEGLAAVAGDARMTPLFEPASGGLVPRSPWSFG